MKWYFRKLLNLYIRLKQMKQIIKYTRLKNSMSYSLKSMPYFVNGNNVIELVIYMFKKRFLPSIIRIVMMLLNYFTV